MDRWETAHDTLYKSIRRFDKTNNKGQIVDNNGKVIVYTEKEDYDAWDILFKSFVDKIGLDPEFKSYIDNLHKLINLQADYILSKKKRGNLVFRDRKILNQIKRIKIEILAFEKTGTTEKKMTVSRVMNKLGRMQGYKIKKSETSVIEYFELLKDFKQWQKAE
jgi:hypothetical protein